MDGYHPCAVGINVKPEEQRPLQLAGDAVAAAVIVDDFFCPECAYNVRGVTGDCCPECGYSLETIRSSETRLPWAVRDRIGRVRAYWRTVRMVMFRQRRLCEEIARPISFADSQKFRWVTIALAYAPVLVSTLIAYATVKAPFDDAMFDGLYAAVWPTAVLHVCFVLYLAAATGVPSYFFHPRFLPVGLQNRAVALSYYGCAPLAWLFVVLVVASLAAAMDMHARGLSVIVLGVWTMIAALYLPWWLVLRRIARRTMPHSPLRLAVISVAVPALWLALALLIFLIVPAVAFYVALMIASMW